jgi:hypothetical protein
VRGQPGFFDIDERLKRLSDQLETVRSTGDFELFRPELNAALSYTDRTEGGRPPFDPVLMLASGVWADTAYRSAANETFLNKNGFVSHIHRKKPKGRAMHETTRRANNAKSKFRSRVEHVFAEQKDRMGLFIRTIGIARATIKIGMANLVYNIKRLIFLRNLAIA